MFETTPLLPVKDWVFNRYHVKFTNGESGDVVLEIDFIGTEGPRPLNDFNPEWGGLTWPTSATHFEWEMVEENVHVRRQQTSMGVVVEGDGWQR